MNTTQKCPICHVEIEPNPRYQNYVCSNCVCLTSDELGRKVRFGNLSIQGGLKGMYCDSGKSYNSFECWIKGIKCKAVEGRFGGIVIQALPEIIFSNSCVGESVLSIRSDQVIYEEDFLIVLSRYYECLKDNSKDIKKSLIQYLNNKYFIDAYVLKTEYEKHKTFVICPECGSYNITISSVDNITIPKEFCYCHDCGFQIPEQFVFRAANFSITKAKSEWRNYKKGIV